MHWLAVASMVGLVPEWIQFQAPVSKGDHWKLFADKLDLPKAAGEARKIVANTFELLRKRLGPHATPSYGENCMCKVGQIDRNNGSLEGNKAACDLQYVLAPFIYRSYERSTGTARLVMVQPMEKAERREYTFPSCSLISSWPIGLSQTTGHISLIANRYKSILEKAPLSKMAFLRTSPRNQDRIPNELSIPSGAFKPCACDIKKWWNM